MLLQPQLALVLEVEVVLVLVLPGAHCQGLERGGQLWVAPVPAQEQNRAPGKKREADAQRREKGRGRHEEIQES